MFYIAYNIISIFLLIPVLLFNLYRSITLGWPLALAERFGRIPQSELAGTDERPVVWVHAVSVGEAAAARPLLKALRKRYPACSIVVSSTTETGKTTASGFQEQDLCIYFPFDFLPSVRRILDDVKPRLIIIMETEIWPNFTREAARRGIPVILANGRISERSFKRYLKFSWFFRHPLQLFSTLCMQTENDRERVIAIGAPPERTLTSGNLKYDIPFQIVTAREKADIRERYAISDEMSVITAASTHSGEEEQILDMYRELSAQSGNLLLILVPRHPERANDVTILLDKANIPYRRRTALPATGAILFHNGEVLLVDTIGEMMPLYAASDVAFVGGSLAPIGGHNLLEPAAVGVPSIFGPHMANFREISSLVLRYQAGIQVHGKDGLADACRRLIDNAEERRRLGENGLRLMQENGGATERHMEVIAAYLEKQVIL